MSGATLVDYRRVQDRSHLKRRRPYESDELLEVTIPQYPPVPQFPPLETTEVGLPPETRLALNQVSSFTNISVTTLVALSQLPNAEAIVQKALREIHDPSLHSLSQKTARPVSDMRLHFPGQSGSLDDQEKQRTEARDNIPPPAGIHGAGSMLQYATEKVINCFSACCNPGYESDSGYHAIPTSSPDVASYGHHGHYADETTSPVHASALASRSGPARQDSGSIDMISPDHGTTGPGFLPNFHPANTVRNEGEYHQDPGREGLPYQDGFPVFHKTEPGITSPTTPGYQPPSLGYDRVPYGSDMMQMVPSPSFPPSHAMPGFPARYGPAYGHDQSDSATHLQLHQGGRPVGSSLEVLYPNQKPPAAKRGPFKNTVDRQQTATTRKNGSCIRCRMQRIRCVSDPSDERGQCVCCKKYKPKMWSIPCMRTKISDVVLSKPGQVQGYEWTKRWKENSVLEDIGHWASSDIKIICVSDGLTGKPVELRVRQFIPQEGDRLERSWMANGIKKTVKIPPFAIVDLDGARAAYDGYIKDGLVECCKRILGSTDELLWKTYAMAFDMLRSNSLSADHRTLIATTLELWMSIRLTTKSFEIVGSEKLGMHDDIMGTAENSRGMIPLPPVMGAQIDSVLIHNIQTKLRHTTLDMLQKLTIENRPKAWLANYLATFILLHNIALVIKHDAGYARKHGMKRRFAREDKVQDYHKGAVTLLAYFHYCHKGIYPFSADCKEADLTNLAELDEMGRNFVYETRRLVAEHKQRFKTLRESKDYENDHFYISQLFEHNWVVPAMDSS